MMRDMNHFHQSGEEQLRVPNLLNSEGQQGLIKGQAAPGEGRAELRLSVNVAASPPLLLCNLPVAIMEKMV
jgi:hypothetical protein